MLMLLCVCWIWFANMFAITTLYDNMSVLCLQLVLLPRSGQKKLEQLSKLVTYEKCSFSAKYEYSTGSL